MEIKARYVLIGLFTLAAVVAVPAAIAPLAVAQMYPRTQQPPPTAMPGPPPAPQIVAPGWPAANQNVAES